jgi:hypothetical protein
VLMPFADDQVCGGEATTHQHMTATATITLENDSQFDLLWSGVGEAQYETLTITVNGVVKETFQALADGSCQMGSCRMQNVQNARADYITEHARRHKHPRSGGRFDRRTVPPRRVLCCALSQSSMH